MTADTVIPDEGLLIEPIAVRTPSGHTTPTEHDEFRLKTEALSHKLTPGAVTMMPSSFHVTSRENLMGIFDHGTNDRGRFRKAHTSKAKKLHSISPLKL